MWSTSRRFPIAVRFATPVATMALRLQSAWRSAAQMRLDGLARAAQSLAHKPFGFIRRYAACFRQPLVRGVLRRSNDSTRHSPCTWRTERASDLWLTVVAFSLAGAPSRIYLRRACAGNAGADSGVDIFCEVNICKVNVCNNVCLQQCLTKSRITLLSTFIVLQSNELPRSFCLIAYHCAC